MEKEPNHCSVGFQPEGSREEVIRYEMPEKELKGRKWMDREKL
jgi:hypothetical protein